MPDRSAPDQVKVRRDLWVNLDGYLKIFREQMRYDHHSKATTDTNASKAQEFTVSTNDVA